MNKKLFPLFAAICISAFFQSASLHAHDNGKSALLETVGGLSAQGVYLTYVAIGSLADGYVYKAFNKKTTTSLLGEYIALSVNSQKLLQKLIDQKIVSGTDIQFTKELIATYSLLIQEAGAFSKYVSQEDANQAKIYDEKRKAAWKKISKLLNIKE
jgi:hypothetical protein